MSENFSAETSFFKMSDDFHLSYRSWEPSSGEAEKAIVCIHGFGGHSGMFKPFGELLAAKGLGVYSLDLRGFGNSKEPDLPRGDTRDFKRHLQDLNEVICLIRGNIQFKKVYMMGSSLGGLYVLWYDAHYPDSIDGLILAAPAVETKPKLLPEAREKLPILFATKPETMLDIVKERAAIEEGAMPKGWLGDPLRTSCFSVRYMCSIGAVLMRDKIFVNAANVKKPTLILQGDSDPEAIPIGAKKLFEALAPADKVLVTFHTSDHSLHNESEPVCSAILNWVSLH